MRFTRLKLENWRNFLSVDVPLAQRVFLVGPNASGKSNLLDALRFLRDVADRAGGLRRAIEERRGMDSIRSLRAPRPSARWFPPTSRSGYSGPFFPPVLIEVENGTPHLCARFMPSRSPYGFHYETELSDGTLRLIGLLWILGAGASPLLLEEPEMSLHAAAVRQLPQVLARVASRMDRQILVSTHSEEMLSDTGIDPSEILILTPGDQGTCVSVGSDDPALVALAAEDAPLSGLLEARTRPRDVEQLSYAFGGDDE